MEYTSVKKAALAIYPDVPILQPEKATDPHFHQEIALFSPDFFFVVGYGKILQRSLLDLTPFPINIHASLLPEYRGAAPMQRALMDGKKVTGITIMKMNEKMDEGEVLAQEKIAIGPEMTLGELEEALSQMGGKLLLKTLASPMCPQAQDSNRATYAPKLEPSEFQIDWSRDAWAIHNQIRALSPKPGAWFYLGREKKRCKILQSLPTQSCSGPGVPGEVLERKNRWIVATQKGSLEILRVQLEGKAPLDARSFLCGFSLPRFLYTKNRD